MSPKKTKKSFSRSAVFRAAGICLILFGALLLLSPRTRLRYVSYPFHALFGTVGFYLFSLLALEGGAHMLFHRRWKAYNARIVIGLILLSVSSWLLIAQIVSGGYEQAYSDVYFENLHAAYQGDGTALYHSGPLAGGYFGVALLSALGRIGAWPIYVTTIAVIVLSLAIIFAPLLNKGMRSARANIAVASAKAQQKKEEREERKRDDYRVETAGDGLSFEPNPIFDSAPSSAPSLSFMSEKEDAPVPMEDPVPMGEYTFAPAGGSTLPKRKSLRLEHVQTPVPPEPSEPAFPRPTGPVELSNPSFDSYANNPVRRSGLKEAVFDPGGSFAPSPQEEMLSTPPFPMREEVREEVKAEVEEEEPVNLAPSFLKEPIREEPEVIPVEPEDSVSSIEPEEEDDAPYEAPMNEPIVLAPNPDVILTPETVAPIKEEPLPEPEREPEPEKEDEDIEKPLPPYVFPDASLLDEPTSGQDLETIRAECQQKALAIDQIFKDFRVGAHVTDILIGPSITRYSVEADPGVSIQAIARIKGDLEVRLGGVATRFVERVLGLACSALEVANDTRRIVSFKEMFVAMPPKRETADLRIPFGIAIDGSLKQADLARFPHMLVAGTSGSGKSVFAHGILMALVMRNRPEDLKLVLIDPKRGVEMAPYKDMPHLLCPIVKEAKPARNCLKKLCALMDERYEKFADVGVSDISSYNADYAFPNGKKRMPYIVVFVDEFADLVGECKDISDYVLRIAQKARACGIHLIVATQRPDVKVITGTIKSNLLCRVALTVASAQDSVTILGQGGAEELYGYGDMLIDCQELSKRDFTRAQGCLGTSRERKAVCDFVRNQMPPMYDPDFLDLEDKDEDEGMPEIRDGGYAPVPQMSSADLKKISDEEKYNYVKSVIMTREYCSISMIQREFEVGFPRAGKILARLQTEGIVAAPDGTSNNSKGCRVLVHDEGDLPPQE